MQCGVDPASCSVPTVQVPAGAGTYATTSSGVDGYGGSGYGGSGYGGPTYGAAVDGVFSQHDGFDVDVDGRRGGAHVTGLDLATGNIGQLAGQQFAQFNVIKDKGGGFADAADALKFASYTDFAYRNVAGDLRTGFDAGSANDRAVRAWQQQQGVPTPPKLLPGVIQTQVKKTKDVAHAVATDTHSTCQRAEDPDVCHLQAILTELQQLEALLGVMGHADKAAATAEVQAKVVDTVQTHLVQGKSAQAAIAAVATQVAQAGSPAGSVNQWGDFGADLAGAFSNNP
jgi:hypothetical protein